MLVGQLVQVLPEWQQAADVYAVYSRSIRSSANLRIFIENLEQYLAQRWQRPVQDERIKVDKNQ